MKQELTEALHAIEDMLARSEGVQKKFAPGSAQHTLQKNRIAALRIAHALLEDALEGSEHLHEKEQLCMAQAPLASLLSKSEKAQQKLSPGSWQHTMLAHNIKALQIACPLLDAALQKF